MIYKWLAYSIQQLHIFNFFSSVFKIDPQTHILILFLLWFLLLLGASKVYKFLSLEFLFFKLSNDITLLSLILFFSLSFGVLFSVSDSLQIVLKSSLSLLFDSEFKIFSVDFLALKDIILLLGVSRAVLSS